MSPADPAPVDGRAWRWSVRLGLWAIATTLAAPSPAQTPAPAPGPAAQAPAPPAVESEIDLDGLFEAGRALFEDYAPEEIKARFRYPTREEFNTFFGQLQGALQADSLSDLAAYKPQAEAALAALQAFPDYAPYVTWLQERLDYIEAADAIVHAAPAPPPVVAPRPAPTPAPAVEPVPHYDLWVGRLRSRPAPAAAARYVEVLQPVFTRARVPPALVWLAEVESAFNPSVRSPVGARGLFQFMPATATGLGLSLRPFDERTDPRKSADAAARYLRQLHGQFGSWPLALAAYNAGPGRVRRTLQSRGATTYADIAGALPVETRMYVPKVLATVALRTGQPLAD